MKPIAPFVLMLALSVVGIATAATATQDTAGSSPGLTTDQVIQMVEAGLGEDLIITRLRRDGKAFNLEVEEMLRLKKAGVSDSILKVMVDPKAAAATDQLVPPAVGGTGAGSALGLEFSRLEAGIYAKSDGEWIELEPEGVTVKQGSGFRMYTGGVNTNARLAGASSKITLRSPVEVLIVTLEGVSASEFQLVRLESSIKRNMREFRVGKFGFTGNKTGIEESKKVEFEHKRIGPRHFSITLPSSVVAGEYAFLPSAAMGGGSFGGPLAAPGKAYSIRVLE